MSDLISLLPGRAPVWWAGRPDAVERRDTRPSSPHALVLCICTMPQLHRLSNGTYTMLSSRRMSLQLGPRVSEEERAQASGSGRRPGQHNATRHPRGERPTSADTGTTQPPARDELEVARRASPPVVAQPRPTSSPGRLTKDRLVSRWSLRMDMDGPNFAKSDGPTSITSTGNGDGVSSGTSPADGASGRGSLRSALAKAREAVATRQNAEPTKRFDVDDPDTWPEDDDEYEYDSYAAAALGRAAPNAHCESPTRARGPSLGAGHVCFGSGTGSVKILTVDLFEQGKVLIHQAQSIPTYTTRTVTCPPSRAYRPRAGGSSVHRRVIIKDTLCSQHTARAGSIHVCRLNPSGSQRLQASSGDRRPPSNSGFRISFFNPWTFTRDGQSRKLGRIA